MRECKRVVVRSLIVFVCVAIEMKSKLNAGGQVPDRQEVPLCAPAPQEWYGEELILDLHGCDIARFTRREIKQFCEELCDLIDMERCDLHFWDDVDVPEEEQQTHPKTKGTSAVQFILTSTIVIHTLDLTRAVYVNIFSCKEFDTDEAAKFTAKWFGSTDWTANVVVRR